MRSILRHPQIRYLLSSRRLGLFLCLVGCIWGVTLINLTLAGYDGAGKDGEQLREQIVMMSEKYVKKLAKDTENTIDGPFAGRLTGYDMKKTMAVLLQDIMTRLERLERKVDLVLTNHSGGNAQEVLRGGAGQLGTAPPLGWGDALVEKMNEIEERVGDPAVQPMRMQDLILGKQEKCDLTPEETQQFPHCGGKIGWMQSHWKSDACYGEYGVDGSYCSFRMYLSEVETWCPLLPGRTALNVSFNRPIRMAELNLDLDGLMGKLQDPGQRKNYEWMRMRIEQLWGRWVASATQLASQQNLSNRTQKKIVVHLGLLTKASGWKFAEGAFKGGPLGELVQWSDIITALYILGHDLTITSEVEQLQAILAKVPKAESLCQSRVNLPVDMIYTDIVGLTQFKKKVKHGFGKFSCLLRIIDSFGTEPAFNWESYAKTHRLKTVWGMQNLNPQQFFTMFPHSPDNSFMGFIVENHLNRSEAGALKKKDQALVYGKQDSMWNDKDTYLHEIHQYLEIHGTVFLDGSSLSNVPTYVVNHGILSGPELHRLLHESKIFIGLGFPYEGPAPLEAIAQGAVFINPKFNPPHSSANVKFFKGKPTVRQLTSQHPYAEQFIGEPYVYTVDIRNPDEVKQAVEKALLAHDEGHIKSYLPFEFTEQGMLQRLNAYIEHQDFCNPLPKLWPPAESVEFVLGQVGQSCKNVCLERKMICEPSHFKRINTEEELQGHVGPCQRTVSEEDIYFPAFEPKTLSCHLQQQPMLFSCVGEHPEYSRLCPCRDFIHGQTALCNSCIVRIR